jgi:hypothetical protein
VLTAAVIVVVSGALLLSLAGLLIGTSTLMRRHAPRVSTNALYCAANLTAGAAGIAARIMGMAGYAWLLAFPNLAIAAYTGLLWSRDRKQRRIMLGGAR